MPLNPAALVLAALFSLARPNFGTQVGSPDRQFRLEYHLRLPRPTTHMVEIEIDAAGLQEPTVDFVMPAWAPGRYAIYNFAKNVQDFRASGAGGRPLRWTQPDKQTWRVDSVASQGVLRVLYRVFANDLTGSFSQIDSTHANINGAGIYMYVAGHKQDPARLDIEPPAAWKTITAFTLATDQHSFEAPNYDRLIDTPIELSTECKIEQFNESGRTFRVVIHNYGTGKPELSGDEAPERKAEASGALPFSLAAMTGTPGLRLSGSAKPLARSPASLAHSSVSKLVEGLKRVVHSEMEMMPAPDFESYTFFFHFAPDVSMGDGMEHLNSTQIIVRGALDDEVAGEALETAAHEFFHLWNVKRLRPAALGPFDYTKENYTPSLWFAEGVTQYYSYVHLLRAAIWTRQDFLARLAEEIRMLEMAPGRALMSAESSSFHAWFYDRAPQMQETNFGTSTISYYNKGALLGLLLDLEIRSRTGGAKSLDDILRSMYRQFYQDAAASSGETHGASSYSLPGRGYEETDILEVVNAVSGSNFANFFAKYVSGTAPLPYDETLARAGLSLKIATGPDSPPRLGADTRQEERGLRIVDIVPGGAADRGGLSRDDLLVDVDQVSLANQDLGTSLKIYPPGAEVPFDLERHNRRLRITVKLDPPVPNQYSIEEVSTAQPEQVRIRQGWIGAQ